ncbi:MAG: hypothetical protein H7Y01_01945 [Ferruginibacter sp.]|nr:hypothetical protein [Chitinophagaceae bacterium]
MKKMIVTLAIALTTLSAFASDENVSQKVLDAFNTEFATAREVEWTVGSNHYKATFTYNGKHVFAYYNENGELLGLTRYLSPVDLPLALQNNLKKNYEGFWVSDLFEVAKNDETNYYITLENADTKIILKSSGNSWSNYNKIKKS